jgi:glycosyltransferase involved in cell wall biosynthesis
LHSALKSQDFKDHELLYIDDGSTDGSWSILEDLSDQDNVRCFRLNKNYPAGYARAFGVEKARGRYVASIDADCIPDANWLSMVERLDSQTAVVGFPVIPPPQLDYLARRFEYRGNGRPRSGHILHGSGVIMKRDVVLAAGNYPPRRVGEDTTLFRRILETGQKAGYTEQARIHHLQRQHTFGDFLRRFYRTGRNNTSVLTFVLFALGFPLLLLLSLGLIYSLGTLGLISLVLPVGFLVNPIRLSSYLRDFAKPRNGLVKLVVFSGIRIAISSTFILGLWGGVPSFRFSRE